jgi:hypothetical protein
MNAKLPGSDEQRTVITGDIRISGSEKSFYFRSKTWEHIVFDEVTGVARELDAE